MNTFNCLQLAYVRSYRDRGFNLPISRHALLPHLDSSTKTTTSLRCWSVMESTALSVGKSVLSGALGYAQSAVAEEVALQLGVQRDHAFIRDELEMMRSFLMAAHEEPDDSMVVKAGVKQVRDVAYDAEDCLQDLGAPSCWGPRTVLERRRVASKMKELRAKVEDVSQRNVRYRLIRAGSGSSKETAMAGDAMLSGMDEARRQQDGAKADLVRLITMKDEHLRVIALWRPSGVLEETNTSIIRRAYDDLKMSNKFECYACVSLMHPVNKKELLLTIVSQIYENLIEAAVERQDRQTPGTDVLRRMVMAKEEDGSHLVDVFVGYVKEKNYLIVLNDLSTIEEWDQIKTCFPDNRKGSRIIVTTKQVEAATLCLGPDCAVPELAQISADKTIYAFYDKVSQGGTVSTMQAEASSSREGDGMVVSALRELDLIGRVNEKKEIINLVSNKNHQGYRVISVWGMGGLGKTTLVRDVYQSQELSGMFEKRAWATVMRPFNCSDLCKNLAKQHGNENQTNLTELLRGRRYLIVLDDVWSNKEWDDIMQYLPQTAASCIIVTTRQQSIAKHCSQEESYIHKLKILDPNDARELFTKKVFRETNWEEKYPELVGQVEPILNKCSGLPLAIVTIGGFLANQPKSAFAWRKLNEHISAELEMNTELEAIRKVLLKSYTGLPYHLKSCFLYLSIFPEDYKISWKHLMQRWITEGCIQEARGKSREEIADDIFMELISRSMILPAEKSVKVGRERINHCQLHDLMLEISITKSMEENLVFRLEEGCSSNIQATKRHITISSNWKRDENEFNSMVDLSRLRSLTVFGEWKPFFISKKMKMLRVLDLENTKGLVSHHLEHIGKLLHLKYLSLRGHNIFRLPDSLGDLKQLETLDIRGTAIVVLPKSIVKLQKLEHLHAGHPYFVEGDHYSLARRCLLLFILPLGCAVELCVPRLLQGDGANRQDVCAGCCMQKDALMMNLLALDGPVLPNGSRKLKGLRTLKYVHLAWGNSVIREIERLTSLRRLGVVGISKKNGQALCSAISKLNHLEYLSVKATHRRKPGMRGCLESSSCPPEKLQSLKLQGFLGELPQQWIQELKHLVKLTLEHTRLERPDQDMRVLGVLPRLAILRLRTYSFKSEDIEGGPCLNFHQEAAMFPSLRALELPNTLKSVEFGEGATLKLEVLQFYGYSSSPGLFSGLKLLPRLKEFLLHNENYYMDEFVKDVQNQLAENPNRPILKRYNPYG